MIALNNPVNPLNTVNQTSAFELLRAEEETAWLSQCFVPPRNLAHLCSNRSIIVFGAIGSGKTALYQQLRQQCYHPDGTPKRLFVDWQLNPADADAIPDIRDSKQQLMHIFDLCAAALATHIAHYPQRFIHAPSFAKDRIIWFIHTHLLSSAPEARLGELFYSQVPGIAVLKDLLAQSPKPILDADASPELVRQQLLLATQDLKLEGVWVMADDIERWAHIDESELLEKLSALLNTLPLFERSEFAFKLFTPRRLESKLSATAGIQRRRVDAFRLSWTQAELQAMVEYRLRFVLQQPSFTLSDLCDSKKLLPWLARVGEHVPREWLDQTHPLLRYFLDNNLKTPIDEKTWFKLRREHPPRLTIDEAQHTIWIGGRQLPISHIPETTFSLLRYLHERPGQYVPKDELYYIAYTGGYRIPNVQDDDYYTVKQQYEATIDTAIWRLRQEIEPDPKKHTLILNKRGRGYSLTTRW
ncbi:MAG: winged helix-turn-helix domain-containing protein [Chloroflexota bacterium]